MTAIPTSLVSIADVLRGNFGIRPDRLEMLAGGYENEVYRSGDLVVQVERRPLDSVEWEHSLVRFLAQRISEVVAPAGPPVERGGAVVSVWPYVDGRPGRRRHAAHALAAADLLGRIHQVGGGWRGGQRPGARPVTGEGPRGPVHGDLYCGNVLFRRGRVVAVVDWEESCVDLLSYDLANAVWEFCKDKRRHDFDRSLAEAMIEAYEGLGDADRLIELICVRRRREIADSLEREARGEPVDVVYRRHNERSLRNLGG